jgi:hypothetical protein
MSNRFSTVTKVTPEAQALINALKTLRMARGRRDKPTQAMWEVYYHAFRALQEANPTTSYTAVKQHIRRYTKEGGA